MRLDLNRRQKNILDLILAKEEIQAGEIHDHFILTLGENVSRPTVNRDIGRASFDRKTWGWSLEFL